MRHISLFINAKEREGLETSIGIAGDFRNDSTLLITNF